MKVQILRHLESRSVTRKYRNDLMRDCRFIPGSQSSPENNRNSHTKKKTSKFILVLPSFPDIDFVLSFFLVTFRVVPRHAIICFHSFSEQQNLFFHFVLLKSISKIPLHATQPAKVTDLRELLSWDIENTYVKFNFP